MDPNRAGELLAQERERIERALGGLAHTDTGEEAYDIDPGNLASDLYQDELDEGLADGLRDQLARLEVLAAVEGSPADRLLVAASADRCCFSSERSILPERGVDPEARPLPSIRATRPSLHSVNAGRRFTLLSAM